MNALILKNKTANTVLATQVVEASTFKQRSKGLLGKSDLPIDETLWIKKCQSIHTFFMKFPIDAVFVDKELRVTNIVSNLKPWRITPYYWKSSSVFEFNAGTIDTDSLNIGDELYVGH